MYQIFFFCCYRISICGIPGWRNGGKVFAHGLDHPPAPYPETGADAHSAIQKQPDGGGCIGHHRAALIQKPESHQWANRIASDKIANVNTLNDHHILYIHSLEKNRKHPFLPDIIPSMSKGAKAGREYLQELEERGDSRLVNLQLILLNSEVPNSFLSHGGIMDCTPAGHC